MARLASQFSQMPSFTLKRVHVRRARCVNGLSFEGYVSPAFPKRIFKVLKGHERIIRYTQESWGSYAWGGFSITGASSASGGLTPGGNVVETIMDGRSFVA